MRLNGVDVTDSGIEIRPNENVTGLDVELTNRLTTVSGQVLNRGDLSKDCFVMVFAQDRNRWGADSRYIKNNRVDKDGRFTIVGLPPGDYFAIAIDKIESGQWGNAEFFDSIQNQAQRFTLAKSETRRLDLKLITAR